MPGPGRRHNEAAVWEVHGVLLPKLKSTRSFRKPKKTLIHSKVSITKRESFIAGRFLANSRRQFEQDFFVVIKVVVVIDLTCTVQIINEGEVIVAGHDDGQCIVN